MPRDAAEQTLKRRARPLSGGDGDYDPILAMARDARVVLLGEASHGTHEFYAERARITRRLIDELGFEAIAVEGDWPDADRVNRWVRGDGDARTADEALGGFKRFPQWMWRNRDVVALLDWLRARNASLGSGARPAGFYGMDLYSLHASMEAVLEYLRRVDPPAALRARQRYGCFDQFGEDAQRYGYVAGLGISESCEREVIRQLVDLQRCAGDYASRAPAGGRDAYFSAEQNARLVRNAEEYYRAMFRGRASSWNLRDQHMAETLETLLDFLGPESKVVMWAHNSHLGDARATEMGRGGELNVGQLVRERWGDAALNVGFSTYTGTVTAASDWDEPARRKRVRPGLAGSYEALLHAVGMPRFMLTPRTDRETFDALSDERLERAIGVIYRPETERQSHYFHANMAEQFDVVLHFDETRALEPLEPGETWHGGEPPETFPSAL